MSRVNKYRVWCKHSWIEDLEEKTEYFMEYNIREVKIEDTPNYPQGRLIGKKGLWCAIHESVFMQYIGVDDKNGKEIYEGDIVKHDISDTIGVVKWYCEDYIGWCVDDIQIGEQQFTDEMWNECEVIGNVYENADLLKEAENE